MSKTQSLLNLAEQIEEARAKLGSAYRAAPGLLANIIIMDALVRAERASDEALAAIDEVIGNAAREAHRNRPREPEPAASDSSPTVWVAEKKEIDIPLGGGGVTLPREER